MDSQLQKEVEVSHRNVSLLKNTLLLFLTILVLPGELATLLFRTYVQRVSDVKTVCICLRKYTEDYISPWKQILSFLLKDYGGKFLLHCNFSAADLPSCLPNFYGECFEVWCNLSVKPILSREQVLNQLLWNNQFLRVGGKPIFNVTRSFFQKVSFLLLIY